MSNDLVVNSSNDDDGSYYSHWLRRKVRKPTPVLFNMIEESEFMFLLNGKFEQTMLFFM